MNEQDYIRRGMAQYTGQPRVMRTGNGVYVIAGTEYGYLHDRDGTIRQWRTYSGARRFLLAHFSQVAR